MKALTALAAILLVSTAAFAGDYCSICQRDSRGRIARSASARREFKREHPCPSTGFSTGRCPGYVIDHVIPLKRGGPDRPENMQW